MHWSYKATIVILLNKVTFCQCRHNAVLSNCIIHVYSTQNSITFLLQTSLFIYFHVCYFEAW